jgi:hypothetical protein
MEKRIQTANSGFQFERFTRAGFARGHNSVNYENSA